MQIRLERRLPCAPEVAFSLVTEPDRMNLWSLARVRSVSPGDGGHPGGVGALRRVVLPARPRTAPRVLEEVVEVAEPPGQFAYRVVSGAPLRDHSGRIRLLPAAGGTRLEWAVDAELSVPGVDWAVRRTLQRSLERSLDRMVEVARGLDARPLPPVRRLTEEEVLDGLLAEADRVVAEQRALADELGTAGDPKRWFTRVYQFVSEALIGACREGRFHHPAWVLRVVEQFHDYYVHNLARALHREVGRVEHHWATAFEEVARPERWKRGRFYGVGYAIYRGMRSHIEEDLPRALAEVYVHHYRGRCDYVRFRADYLRMGNLFRGAGDRLLDELRWHEVPLRTHLSRRILPDGARDSLMAKGFYDLPRKRREAFERGERLVNLIERAREVRA